MKNTTPKQLFKTLSIPILALTLLFINIFLIPPPQKTLANTPGLQTDTRLKSNSCIDNYTSWTHSTEYKADNPWSTDFMPVSYNTSSNPNNDRERFLDVNGDGLLDYVYYHGGYGFYSGGWSMGKFSCVYLNTGTGWKKAYRCVSTERSTDYGENFYSDFYGDCAKTE